MFKDHVTSTERLDFTSILVDRFDGKECAGCGQTDFEIAEQHGLSKAELDKLSIWDWNGTWLCFPECGIDMNKSYRG